MTIRLGLQKDCANIVACFSEKHKLQTFELCTKCVIAAQGKVSVFQIISCLSGHKFRDGMKINLQWLEIGLVRKSIINFFFSFFYWYNFLSKLHYHSLQLLWAKTIFKTLLYDVIKLTWLKVFSFFVNTSFNLHAQVEATLTKIIRTRKLVLQKILQS